LTVPLPRVLNAGGVSDDSTAASNVRLKRRTPERVIFAGVLCSRR
jgi:hypothetical protein